MNHSWIFRVIAAAHFQICFSKKDLDEMLSGRYFNGDAKQYCETIRLTIVSFGICACVVTMSWKMMGQLQLFFDAIRTVTFELSFNSLRNLVCAIKITKLDWCLKLGLLKCRTGELANARVPDRKPDLKKGLCNEVDCSNKIQYCIVHDTIQ